MDAGSELDSTKLISHLSPSINELINAAPPGQFATIRPLYSEECWTRPLQILPPPLPLVKVLVVKCFIEPQILRFVHSSAFSPSLLHHIPSHIYLAVSLHKSQLGETMRKTKKAAAQLAKANLSTPDDAATDKPQNRFFSNSALVYF